MACKILWLHQMVEKYIALATGPKYGAQQNVGYSFVERFHLKITIEL